MLFANAFQHFAQLCVFDDWNNPQFHHVTPHERKFRQGFGIIAC